MKMVRKSLRQANLAKCEIGQGVEQYLGFHSGNGQVHPQIIKTADIALAVAQDQEGVRQFLELAEEWSVVSNYLDCNGPQTDLNKKEAPDPSRPFLRWLCYMEVLCFIICRKISWRQFVTGFGVEDHPLLYMSCLPTFHCQTQETPEREMSHH